MQIWSGGHGQEEVKIADFALAKELTATQSRSPPSMVGVTVLNDLFAELQRGFFGGHPPL